MVHTTMDHLNFLCERMRQEEIDQYLFVFSKSVFIPSDCAQFCWGLNGPKFTVLDANGEPAAAGGFFHLGDGLWESWMIGSEHGWSSSWRSLTKAARWLLDALFQTGKAERVVTRSLLCRHKALKWFESSLQMSCESEYAGIGCYVRDL